MLMLLKSQSCTSTHTHELQIVSLVGFLSMKSESAKKKLWQRTESNYETCFSNKNDEKQINYAKLNKQNPRCVEDYIEMVTAHTNATAARTLDQAASRK